MNRRVTEAWGWFRAFPLVVQLGAGCVLLAIVLWGAGWLEGTVSSVRDWWTDRDVAEKPAEIDQLKTRNAELEGVLSTTREELGRTREAIAVKDREIERLAKEAGEQDARIEAGRKRVREVRRGRDPRPIRDRDELDRRLRGLYPDAERR